MAADSKESAVIFLVVYTKIENVAVPMVARGFVE